MFEGDNRSESVWAWLKKQAASERQGGFTAQVVDERHEVTNDNLDALWHFAIAGIIRPDRDTQFTFTDEGRSIITEDVSPYQYDEFLEVIKYSAPLLDADSMAYLSLALSCIYQVPAAAVVLSRVALELELDSLVAVSKSKWKSLGSGPSSNLNSRDLAVRVRELVRQLHDRDIQGTDDNKLMDSHISVIRITANRVLHPDIGLPALNPNFVQSILYAFKGFASLASEVKAKLQSQPP